MVRSLLEEWVHVALEVRKRLVASIFEAITLTPEQEEVGCIPDVETIRLVRDDRGWLRPVVSSCL